MLQRELSQERMDEDNYYLVRRIELNAGGHNAVAQASVVHSLVLGILILSQPSANRGG